MVCEVLSYYILIVKQSEVEETLKRIANHKGVMGYVIVNNEGIPLRSTGVQIEAKKNEYATKLTELAAQARSVVRDLNPQVCNLYLRNSCFYSLFF